MVAIKGIRLSVFIITSIIDTKLKAVKRDESNPPKVLGVLSQGFSAYSEL